MSLSTQVDVSGAERVRAYLTKLHATLDEPGERVHLHRSIASYTATLTARYLTTLAGTRHDTARRLGANPSGHLARAAESVISEGTDQAAVVSVVSPGLRRAFGPMTIQPRNGAKYLTIPATAEAYNRRAGSFNDLRLAVFGGGRYLALVKAEQSSLADRKRSGFETDQQQAGLGWRRRGTIYYWLKKSVTQPQDRSLLPSDEDYAEEAVEGIKAYLRLLRAAEAATA